MTFIQTNEFLNNAVHSERGLKSVILGYAFVNDDKNWLKSKSGNLKTVTLKELIDNCELVIDESKTNDNIERNLFNVTYEPSVELKTIDSESFGTYKIRVNYALNNSTENGICGNYRAIALVGEQYTESQDFVKETGKTYLAYLIYFGEEGLEINKDSNFTINFQFTLSENDSISSEISLDEDYENIARKTSLKDQTTTQISIPGIFLTPSGKEYSNKVEKINGVRAANEGISYIDKTLNLVPNSYRNNNLFNVTPRVNIFDSHDEKFVRPQTLISYGNLNEEGTFNAQSVSLEFDPKYFKMNEKAPTASTRIDLFGGASYQNTYYNDFNYNSMDGYFRLLTDAGKNSGGSGNIFIKSSNVSSNVTDGSFILSNNDSIALENNNVNVYRSRNNKFSAVSDAHIFDTSSTKAESQSGIIEIGSVNVSAITTAFKFDYSNSELYNRLHESTNSAAGHSIFIGKNISSVNFNGQNNIFIGHKGLLSNFGNDAVLFGNNNACGNKEYISTESGYEESYDATSADVFYEDGKIVAVGDGYFYKHLTPKEFSNYENFINVNPENNCDVLTGDYIKRLNVFSVERKTLLNVHPNEYDDNVGDEAQKEAADFFATRAWCKNNDLNERYANQLNACFSNDTIFFTKTTAHNEEWKLRISELNNFIHDNYNSVVSETLKTNALNKIINDYYSEANKYILKLEPIYSYILKSGSMKIEEGATKGVKGTKGMRGLLKRAFDENLNLTVTDTRNIFYLSDLLKAVKQEYGADIGNNGIKGKDNTLYTLYCVNGTKGETLYYKGVRLRNNNKNKQLIYNSVQSSPGVCQRIIYKNKGYYGEYGMLNFNFNDKI